MSIWDSVIQDLELRGLKRSRKEERKREKAKAKSLSIA